MLKSLSEAAAVALSFVAVVGTAHAEIQVPDQCWPYCSEWLENLQCQAWFGPSYTYCGWVNGYTYCCN
jgi:hypothetical protein